MKPGSPGTAAVVHALAGTAAAKATPGFPYSTDEPIPDRLLRSE